MRPWTPGSAAAWAGIQGLLHLLAWLGGLGSVAVLTAALVLACLVARRWRGAVLAGLAVPAAVALTEFGLKPLVGRSISGYPSFPSGHATAMFALAATCAVLLANPPRPRLPRSVRLALVAGAVLVAAAVPVAMVALGYHYFTDIVAGHGGRHRDGAADRAAHRPGPPGWRAARHGRGGHRRAQRRSFTVTGAAGKNFAAPANRLPPGRNREAMDDDALIAAVARRDDTALRELFSRHAPWLAARLRGVLPAAEVEDVLQETFLAVWRGAAGYRPEGSAGGWLWGIARRQAALWLRRRGPAELLLPALIAARRPAPGRSGGGGGVPGRAGQGGRRPGPGGRPGARDLAADVRRRQERGRGGGADGRLGRHGEEPCAPGPAADARGPAAARAGRGGRRAMTGWDEPMSGHREAGPAPGDVDLDRVWLGVAAQVWRRRPGPAERAAGRLLRSPGLARALVTTPSLLLGWVIATVVILLAGVGIALGTGTPWVALLAPAVAAAGIAYAYGPGIDPAWELSQSMAVSDRMVLLVRALAVFGLNAVLGLAASAASGAAAAVTFGWLVPMTAVCALALAAATVTRSPNAGVAAGLAGWVITILAGQAAEGRFTAAITDSFFVLPYLAFAACCGAVVLFATRTPRGTP